MNRHIANGFTTAILGFIFTFQARADIVAVDGAVPNTMDEGGTFENPAEYIIGNTGPYDIDFGYGGPFVGEFNPYNSLTIRLGSLVGGAAPQVGMQSDFNNVLVNGVGSTWTIGDVNSGFLYIGHLGSGNSLTIENGGLVNNPGTSVQSEHFIGYGDNSNTALGNNNSVAVTGTGSSWTMVDSYSQLYVGYFGSGNSLTVDTGGSVSNTNGIIGLGSTSNTALGNDNSVTVTGTGSVWTNSESLNVGSRGSGNSLSIHEGASVSNTIGTIGFGNDTNSALGNNNTVTVSGTDSTWINSQALRVGYSGSGNSLIIEEGATVSNVGAVIGRGGTNPALGNNNSVTVAGAGSTWISTSNVTVGEWGSGNTLTIQDTALVRIGGTLSISAQIDSENNFIRLHDGYLAIFGDQTTYLSNLITNGHLQLWDGLTWVTSSNLNNYEFAFFASNAAAEAFSGYQNLGGYTIATASTVPEPSTGVFLLLGAGALLFRRLSTKRSGNSNPTN